MAATARICLGAAMEGNQAAQQRLDAATLAPRNPAVRLFCAHRPPGPVPSRSRPPFRPTCPALSGLRT